MTSREFLDYEVSLLLLRHGKEALLSSVARRIGLSDDVLRQELGALLHAKNVRPAEKKKLAPKQFELDPLLIGREDKASYLRQLCARFDNRTFLPELKDVKRFLDRHGQSHNAKSRALAQAALFQVLADLDVSELLKLLAESLVGVETSSLGLISDEILGRNRPG